VAKRQKLLDKLLSGSNDIHFEEFTSLLEGFAFELERVRGSHHVYSHPGIGELLSVQPRHDGKAKPYQLRQFLKLVEEYNLELKKD
jgi:predicted RNA binding protein YcfA (HicA-like mRNA interferase family)